MKKIWLCEAGKDGFGLTVVSLQSLAQISGNAASLKPFEILVNELQNRNPDEVGADFPLALFGWTKANWQNAIDNFVREFRDIESFEAFRKTEREMKRTCERHARVPFATTNLRMYRQSFYALQKVVFPLYSKGWSILPFVTNQACPALFEVCPASFLKKNYPDYSTGYKGKSPQNKLQRHRILNSLVKDYSIVINDEQRSLIQNDSEGDALVALLCVLCLAFGERLEFEDGMVVF